jgi:hypothetical protein
VIRDWLIEWLVPELAILERKYQNLQNRVSEARWWMGSEFPEVSNAMRWVEASHANYCGGREEAVKDKPWIHDISDFREHMRNAKTIQGGTVPDDAVIEYAPRVRTRKQLG